MYEAVSCVSRSFCHKMWDVSLMIPLKVFDNIRSFEKSTHLLIGSDARMANFPRIQTDLSITPFFINAL